jgi:hypothetical protein
MCPLLLKKALPFALTFVLGSLVGGAFKLFGVGGRTAAPAVSYYEGYDGGRRHCRARLRARTLVAETKPLTILFKPDARLPGVFGESWHVQVTFGADSKVQAVEPVGDWKPGECRGSTPQKWEAIVGAARQIQFEPETVDGVPVTVTREVDIQLMPE